MIEDVGTRLEGTYREMIAALLGRYRRRLASRSGSGSPTTSSSSSNTRQQATAPRDPSTTSNTPRSSSRNALGLSDSQGGDRDWRAFYRHCCSIPRLSGLWVGKYGSHGDEYVKVFQKGYELNAIKLTGTARALIFFACLSHTRA